jgi:sugar O-acyltransferase (sialic acid O-acetyltransferase NeuD family)
MNSGKSIRREGDLLIVGSGGFGRETAQAVYSLNAAGKAWRLLGYIDDDPTRHASTIDGTAVLGGRDRVAQMPETSVVVCTGNPRDYVSRLRIVNDLDLPSERFATIVHPSATVSHSSSIGVGSVLLAQVCLTAAVQVGAHVAIMPHVTLTHDDVVDDFATIASGVHLGGGVRIEKGAYIGAGAMVREGLTVGAFSLVGMGAVLTRSVPPFQVWAGVPARFLRMADVPIELNLQGMS